MSSIYVMLTGRRGEGYTHASLSFSPDLRRFYSFGRKYARFPLPMGFVEERPDSGYLGRHGELSCALLELIVEEPVFRKARSEAEQVAVWAKEYQYNFLGLLLRRMNLQRERPGYYFSCQFVGEVLERSGAVRLPKPAGLLYASDFEGMRELHCLYRGRLDGLWKAAEEETERANTADG